jgi:hypothetical protein
MKFLYLFLILTLISGCKETNKQKVDVENNSVLIKDIKLLKSENYKTPIQTFISFANKNAKEAITITKSNIKSALKKAEKHKYSAIVVGKHTIAKIIDFDDCSQSGKWETCMPKAEGYIKKGTLNYKNDYINNIIGLPDSQERILYLFN